MSNKILIKSGSGAPANGVLDTAELGFDKTNEELYIGNNGSSISLTGNLVYVSETNQESAVVPLNADTLQGHAASYYAKATKLTPRNLLDNSDFRNPVNQRGVTVPSNGFIVDRWYAFDGEVTVSEDGITTTGNGYLQQRLPVGTIKPGKAHTLAVYYSDGTFDVNTNGEYASIADFDIVNYIKSNGKTIASVALYEGEYTVETLPEYQPKGYAAELLECMRYYQQSFVDTPKTTANLKLAFGANVNWVQSVSFDFHMRCTPTVTLYDYVTGTANAMGKWDDDSLVSDVTVGNIGNKSFSPLKAGGIITNASYGFHYTASADL